MAKSKEQKEKKEQKLQPPQQQEAPGVESEMTPKPKADDEQYRGSGKLQDKVALITGADSGIGRAVAMSPTSRFASTHLLKKVQMWRFFT